MFIRVLKTSLGLIRGLYKGHQFCFIENDVKLGNNVFIGFGCVVRTGTSIGDDCSFGHLTVIEGAKIGNRVAFHAQCHLTKGTVIEDDVFVGPGYVSTNTRNIDHGRGINPPIEGPTIKRAARIGGGVILTPGVTIGENAFVGAGSLVTKDIPAREIWFGSPAKKKGDVTEVEIL